MPDSLKLIQKACILGAQVMAWFHRLSSKVLSGTA